MENQSDPETLNFYRRVLETLNDAGVPFLVGGAYALNVYAHVSRNTKDLDLFIRRSDFDQVSAALERVGFSIELTFPHWLGKAHFNGDFIDIIFNSGNGIAEVDDRWFEHASHHDILGIPALLSPVEEMIWSKAFIMERERYDGADVVHLLQACAAQLDWQRLLDRFGDHWRVLLTHFILFGFVYPAGRNAIPVWVMDELIGRLREEVHAPPPAGAVCYGTLLSREQYLPDLNQAGYRDARLTDASTMTAKDAEIWTEAIKKNREKE